MLQKLHQKSSSVRKTNSPLEAGRSGVPAPERYRSTSGWSSPFVDDMGASRSALASPLLVTLARELAAAMTPDFWYSETRFSKKLAFEDKLIICATNDAQ